MQLVWLLALTLTLSPGAREQLVDAPGMPANRELHFALSKILLLLGEKAGMRAGVFLN